MADEPDDIGQDIANAIAANEAKGAAPVPSEPSPGVQPEPAAAAPAPDAGEPKPAKEGRDEKGRFVAKEEKAPEAKAVAEAAEAKPEQPQAPVAEEQKAEQPAVEPAPLGWKGGAKTKWAQLPAAVRQEIAADYKRINEIESRAKGFDSVVPPQRAQVLAAQYGSVERGLQAILAGADMAAQNPQGFILWLAQQRGIDLTQLAGQGGMQSEGEQPPAYVSRLEQMVSGLQNKLASFEQQQTTSRQSELQASIESFAADPAHPYFNDVRTEMSALLQAGRAKDLQQAYDMAVWANPDVRQALLEAERQKVASTQAAKVQQAKSAAVSISGSPGGSKPSDGDLNMDLESMVRRQVDRAFA